MKKIWGIIIIIIFVFFLDFITEKHTNNTISEITRKLEELNDSIEESYEEGKYYIDKDNSQKNIEISNEILELWRKKDNVLSFYIEHDEIEKVSDKINTFNKEIETRNYTDAVVDIIEAEFLLNHITEKQSLSLKNIF